MHAAVTVTVALIVIKVTLGVTSLVILAVTGFRGLADRSGRRGRAHGFEFECNLFLKLTVENILLQ